MASMTYFVVLLARLAKRIQHLPLSGWLAQWPRQKPGQSPSHVQAIRRRVNLPTR